MVCTKPANHFRKTTRKVFLHKNQLAINQRKNYDFNDLHGSTSNQTFLVTALTVIAPLPNVMISLVNSLYLTLINENVKRK